MAPDLRPTTTDHNKTTMTEENKKPDPLDMLRGGKEVTVTLASGDEEIVTVREVTPDDLFNGQYVDLLREDIFSLLEMMCDRPKGWAKQLTRDSFSELREAEDVLNFEYALAEIRAAHARGQKLRFVDEAIEETSRRVLEMITSISSSVNTAASRGVAKKRPVATPSTGSKK